MPPKKKSNSKVLKKAESIFPDQQASSELETLARTEPQKIPKKPLFRYVDYSNTTRARQIRIKCWKILSSKFSNFCDDWTSHNIDPLTSLGQRIRDNLNYFLSTIKHSSLKKCLRFVKKFQIDLHLFRKPRFVRQLCFSWKLQDLSLTLDAMAKLDKIWKAFVNSKLKSCTLNYRFASASRGIDPKLISSLRRLRKCDLLVKSSLNDLKMLINTDKLLPYNKIQTLIQTETDPSNNFIMNQALIRAPQCFKKIFYQCNDNPERGLNIIPDLPQFPNLQELGFSWNAHYRGERIVDISFVQQFQQLKSLSIQLDHRESETLNFLENLPKLQEFCFSSKQSTIREGPFRKLPNLTKLEKLRLCLGQPSIMKMENVREFILNNKRLKSLDLGLSIQDFATVFEEDQDNQFIVPSLEKMQIDLLSVERPFAGAAKRIAKVLKQHNSLKELILEIQQSSADLNVILFKDGLAHLQFLQHLELKFHMTGGLEENKFKHLKEVFMNLTNLTSLDLNLNSDSLGPRDLGPILDGLEKLQLLKRMRWQSKLAKLTPAVEKKLSKYLISLRRLKGLDLSLRGLSEEARKEIRENVLPKFTLSNEPFLFLP